MIDGCSDLRNCTCYCKLGISHFSFSQTHSSLSLFLQLAWMYECVCVRLVYMSLIYPIKPYLFILKREVSSVLCLQVNVLNCCYCAN